MSSMRGKGGCGVSAKEYSWAHGAQINFGDLTPYLTYGATPLLQTSTDSSTHPVKNAPNIFRNKSAACSNRLRVQIIPQPCRTIFYSACILAWSGRVGGRGGVRWGGRSRRSRGEGGVAAPRSVRSGGGTRRSPDLSENVGMVLKS